VLDSKSVGFTGEEMSDDLTPVVVSKTREDAETYGELLEKAGVKYSIVESN